MMTALRRGGLPVCAACILACAWWALAPLPAHELEGKPALPSAPEAPTVELAALDMAAFRAPLWVAPPAPPAPEPDPAPPPPPEPLRLQLIAIARNGDVYSAVLFDPDANALLEVRPGEPLAAGRVVRSITEAGMTVAGDDGTQTLVLHDEHGGRR